MTGRTVDLAKLDNDGIGDTIVEDGLLRHLFPSKAPFPGCTLGVQDTTSPVSPSLTPLPAILRTRCAHIFPAWATVITVDPRRNLGGYIEGSTKEEDITYEEKA